MKLSNMPIGRKLALIFFVLLLPILLVCWLLVSEKRIFIDFAEKELDGDRYLVTTRDLQLELLAQQRALTADGAAVDLAKISARLDAVKRIDQELGVAMGTTDVLGDLTKAAASLGAAAPGLKPAGADAAFGPAITALRALIVRVGDNSNLILDPDLDSYYAMDILLGKMPDLVQRLAEVAQIARDVTHDGTIEADEKTRFLIAQGGLSATIDGLQSSVEQGFRGNQDGSMKAALGGRAEAAKRSLAAFVDSAVKGVTEQGGKLDGVPFEGVRRTAEADAVALWQATMTEMDRLLAVRIAGFYSKLYFHLGLVVLGVLLAGAIAAAIARSIRRPLVAIADTVDAMKAGDTTIVIAGQARRDEIGNIARALETFREAMLERAALQRHEAEEAANQIVRAANRDRHVHEFQDRIQQILAMLQKASGALSEQSDHLRQIVDHTNDRCLTVSASSEQTRETIQSAAAATEELSASISEIARQIADSAAVAGAAMEKIKGSNAAVDSLNTAARQIGDVVSLISDIAGQTNLLALNATIEAARAGEAGKGFAVVATEVKSLAAQTARATEQIAAHITDMQQASGVAASAMREVGSTVERMNEIATAISGAVEQQGAASREIANNVGQASAGASSVHTSIRDVAEIATEAATGAQQTGETASGLAHGVSDLEGAVARFLDGLNKEAS